MELLELKLAEQERQISELKRLVNTLKNTVEGLMFCNDIHDIKINSIEKRHENLHEFILERSK